jgi:hypothetical protein
MRVWFFDNGRRSMGETSREPCEALDICELNKAYAVGGPRVAYKRCMVEIGERPNTQS